MIHSKELSERNLKAINNGVIGVEFIDASYKNDLVDFIEAEFKDVLIRVGLPNVETAEEEDLANEKYNTFSAYHQSINEDTEQIYFANNNGSEDLTLTDVIGLINEFVLHYMFE